MQRSQSKNSETGVVAITYSYDYYTEHNTGHEVEVGESGAGQGGGGDHRRAEPELLGQHAAGAAQGGACEDRGL